MKKLHVTELLTCVIGTELVGALSGLLAGNMRTFYRSLERPPLSPPGWLFPVMWGILYGIMGVTLYWIRHASGTSTEKKTAYCWYAVQLILNFLWSIVFFRCRSVGGALVVLLLLLAAVLVMTVRFGTLRPAAGWWNVPYLLWLLFAAYLNVGILLLN